MSEWITDWAKIDDSKWYFVCPINKSGDRVYLGQPEARVGWSVKRLLRGCYAALERPEFDAAKYELWFDAMVGK